MTAFTPLPDLARTRGYADFRAPLFEIRIADAGLPQDVLRDVIEVTYSDSMADIDRFEVTVSNWDDTARRHKYYGSESEGDAGDPDGSDHPFTIFEPSLTTAELHLGYAGALTLMMRGRFTSVEPVFPAAGRPTLTATALNVLQRLRRKPYSGNWRGRKPSAIADEIAHLRDGNTRRFPVPIDTVEGALTRESPADLDQVNQHDVDFLLNLARQFGYELELRQVAQPGGGSEERLWFGRPALAPDPANLSLHWGATLIDFKPTLTTASQLRSVTVRGWDRSTQRAIEEEVTFEDRELQAQNADLHPVLQRVEPRQEIVVDLPVENAADARRRGLAIMRDRNATLITARGTCIGMPDMRSGRRVEITGLGGRFSGQYLLTATRHSQGEEGYITRFECRREHFAAGVR